MRIGIITYHSVFNFGANLQVYSTIGYLRKNGFDPVVINWMPEDLEAGYMKGNPSVQAEAHKNFINTYLPMTELCRNSEDVADTIKRNKIEAVIIGSDAVLQHRTFLSRIRLTRKGIYLKEKRSNLIFPNPFWGCFLQYMPENYSVFVMSASSQNTNYRQILGKKRKDIGKSILKLKYITVRDEWTKNMIVYLTRKKIYPEITPDPVFAFNNNILDQISRDELKKKFSLPEKYVLLSFKNHGVVSEEWIIKFQRLVANDGIKCIILTMPGGMIFKKINMHSINPPLSPLEWYGLIKYSSGYIGENMHPIVVALHNNVPFFSFDDYGIVRFKYQVNEKSSKIYSLLSEAGFRENRVCTLGKKYKQPSPEAVKEKLINFDYDKCKMFSGIQLDHYVKMMKKITDFFC